MGSVTIRFEDVHAELEAKLREEKNMSAVVRKALSIYYGAEKVSLPLDKIPVKAEAMPEIKEPVKEIAPIVETVKMEPIKETFKEPVKPKVASMGGGIRATIGSGMPKVFTPTKK